MVMVRRGRMVRGYCRMGEYSKGNSLTDECPDDIQSRRNPLEETVGTAYTATLTLASVLSIPKAQFVTICNACHL